MKVCVIIVSEINARICYLKVCLSDVDGTHVNTIRLKGRMLTKGLPYVVSVRRELLEHCFVYT